MPRQALAAKHMSNYPKRATYRKRQCIGCGLPVATNRYAQHRRSDACNGRPSPCPTECREHARPWPCRVCELVTLFGMGFGEADIAQRLGVGMRLVREEVSLLRRKWRDA